MKSAPMFAIAKLIRVNSSAKQIISQSVNEFLTSVYGIYVTSILSDMVTTFKRKNSGPQNRHAVRFVKKSERIKGIGII